jgi:glutaredoxin 3
MTEKVSVIVYTSGWCGYCTGAKKILDKKGVEYTEIRVDKEADKREEMEQRSNRFTVPQIFIGDVHVGGFDDLVDLDLDGDLDSMLGIAS